MGEDAELLRGVVRAVVPRRDDIESELALELGERLLLGAPAADEGVQGRTIQGQVRGDDRVLEMALVGGEEIELEVLGTRVAESVVNISTLRRAGAPPVAAGPLT